MVGLHESLQAKPSKHHQGTITMHLSHLHAGTTHAHQQPPASMHNPLGYLDVGRDLSHAGADSLHQDHTTFFTCPSPALSNKGAVRMSGYGAPCEKHTLAQHHVQGLLPLVEGPALKPPCTRPSHVMHQLGVACLHPCMQGDACREPKSTRYLNPNLGFRFSRS